MLEPFTLQTFTPLVGTSFRVQAAADRAVELALTAARSRSPTGNPFSLVFAGPRQPVLPQATYPFEHGTLGRFDLFICPIGQSATNTSYEAVFNRMP